MMRRAILLAAALVAGASAGAQTVRFLGDLDTPLADLAVQAPGGCTWGNFRVPGSVELPYADIISCRAGVDSVVCGCSGGWAVAEMHLLLANVGTGAALGSLLIVVDGQGWGTWPSGCPEPVSGYWSGLASAWLEVTLPDPGYYEIAWAADSACAFFGYEYFFKAMLTGDAGLRLVTDADGRRECAVLFAQHMGERWWWTDVFWDSDYWSSEAGAPIWWVEASCCEPPVRTEARTWGSIKAGYR